jgi:hypothetical protein
MESFLFFSGETATCMYNSPHETESLARVLPGKLLTLDAQCRKDRGTSACFKVPTYFVHKCPLYLLKNRLSLLFSNYRPKQPVNTRFGQLVIWFLVTLDEMKRAKIEIKSSKVRSF